MAQVQETYDELRDERDMLRSELEEAETALRQERERYRYEIVSESPALWFVFSGGIFRVDDPDAMPNLTARERSYLRAALDIAKEAGKSSWE